MVTAEEIADGGDQAERLEGVLVTVENVAIMNPNPDGPNNDYGQIEIYEGLWLDDLIVRNLTDGELCPRRACGSNRSPASPTTALSTSCSRETPAIGPGTLRVPCALDGAY